jgi:ATP-dependent protease HslVU (ClpYQ) peptidase subunit
MTIVVGVESKEGVTLAADRQRTGWTAAYIADMPKVHLAAPWLGIGVSGSSRIADIVRYTISEDFLKRNPLNDNVHQWLVTELVPKLRTAAKDQGALNRTNEVEDTHSNILVAVGNKLYHVSSDWQVFRRDHGYDAIGSGFSYALGSLFRSAVPDAVLACSAAKEFDSACGGPVDVIRTVAP